MSVLIGRPRVAGSLLLGPMMSPRAQRRQGEILGCPPEASGPARRDCGVLDAVVPAS